MHTLYEKSEHYNHGRSLVSVHGGLGVGSSGDTNP